MNFENLVHAGHIDANTADRALDVGESVSAMAPAVDTDLQGCIE